MIKAFKKHISQPWHLVGKHRRVYENRGKYFRYLTTPRKPIMLMK